MKSLTALAAALVLAAPQALAAGPTVDGPTLKVGDKAPALSIAKWIKGSPVESFERGKFYVVEFWATWCGPCIQGMPHLSEIQSAYRDKGLTIISVTSADPRNTLEKVEKMTADKGDIMGYTVAWDEGRKTNEAYMKAAQQNGIPCAFLVDGEGKIVYVGHPMWLDMAVEGVVAGTWDAAEGPKKIAAVEKRFSEIYQLANKDPEKALEAIDAFVREHPSFGSQLRDMKYALLLRTKSYEKAWALASVMVDEAAHDKNWNMLNGLAWSMVDPEAAHEVMNLDLALRAATSAAELTEHEEPAVLDTLARVHFTRGEVERAIEIQTKAVGLAEDRMKEILEENLAEYRKGLEKVPN